MYTDALYALLHYLAIFALIVTLSLELVLCKGALDVTTIRRLSRLDAAYFVAAILALGTGLLRAIVGAKGWSFYEDNLFFWLKITAFAAIGLISIVPTLAFMRWRKANTSITADESSRVRRYLFWETLLLPLVPICAVLMARGVALL